MAVEEPKSLQQAIPRFQYALVMRGKDVTAALDPYVTRIEFRDNIEGESDQLDIDVEDVDGRWREAWYPSKGDALLLSLGRRAEPMITLATTEIDEIRFRGPPSTVSVRALSTGINGGYRTREPRPFENMTLKQIAQHVARRRKLTLVGTIRDIRIDRVTQYHERDVEFLARLAREYGYAFKITGGKLVFHALDAMREQAGILTLTEADLSDYEFSDQIKDVASSVESRYHDPRKKRLIRRRHKAEGVGASTDTLRLRTRAGTPDMARHRTEAALARANDDRLAGSLSLRGNPRLVSGASFTLEGMGKLDGTWLIRAAVHRITRQTGYATNLQVRQTKPARRQS
ncbi:phage late control D family protein [Cupriavidus metallidurans]|uniref:Phage protein D n=1 Tax=Cupriavidus metallidurans TaxID=119219 RepID=A0A482IQQ9_9BURK|nr:contractile injection system protein, VgrG/Pvc8 family [Cupriavidus metallidurans]QBP09857.1 hypothetical protein DDF84_008830 [Cupriavidus metallidurans]